MENTNLTLKEIIDVTNGNLVYGNENEECISFERDTRAIKDGDIFIGFKGETVDGGIRYKEALENGAKGCIINKCANEKLEKIENKFILEVEDTILKQLQQIANI